MFAPGAYFASSEGKATSSAAHFDLVETTGMAAALCCITKSTHWPKQMVDSG